ncbi:MAG: hypothetical protein JST73_10705, partial [Actinobacteria bacterium]|nr:hypothetical protein [Actinomycetota bacterium]
MKKAICNAVAGIAVVTIAVSACSSSGSSTKAKPVTLDSATSVVARPAGASATPTLLTGGKGILLISPRPGPDLAKVGYVESEYKVAGTATAYAQSNGATAFPSDGMMSLKPTTKADYATRIVVRRPKDPAKFNGTVVVEWNNVSGGLDVAPDWTYTANEIVRSGAAWVGVSAQMIGIEGGPVAVETALSKMGGAGLGIKAQDPARYGTLHHPGDAYSYDIYTQVARMLRNPTGPVRPLGDLQPKRLIAMGESQSAFALTTYYDGVQPLTHEFDGFLVHSRGSSALPLGEPGKPTDIVSAVTGAVPVRFRTDLTAPVMVVATETDVAGILQYVKALQPDNAHLRIWQAAGTAHVDAYQLGGAAAAFGCAAPVNAGPDNFIVGAALAKLNDWIVHGTPPAHSPALKVDAAKTDYVRDANGIAEGGIRTPQVDVPVDVLSGIPAPGGPTACMLSGTTRPIPDATLAKMYPSVADYNAAYAKATD